MVTEEQARAATLFHIDWLDNNGHINMVSEADYRKACNIARKMAKKHGGSYLMPIINGKRAAQWIYSDRYSRHFDN